MFFYHLTGRLQKKTILLVCFRLLRNIGISSVAVLPPSDLPQDQVKSDRQKHRLNKRKAISDLLSNTREELFAGEFEG